MSVQLTRASQVPAVRTAILASADASFRERVRQALTGLRWQVREASGGADALAQLDSAPAETVILDAWLPDLDIQELIAELARLYPASDLLTSDGSPAGDAPARSPRRNEVLYALRQVQDGDGGLSGMASDAGPLAASASRKAFADGAAWNSAPSISEAGSPRSRAPVQLIPLDEDEVRQAARMAPMHEVRTAQAPLRLPEFVGTDPAMLEVSRRIRLVAARPTPVLVQGPTGSGKELVARALHRLSPRSNQAFVALNCAAIPEALLEAELFGHTRGAFTGAVQGRVGRIEAAHGGTLFLDEIGEMPLALQSKLLRFLECGELQRVGENEPVRVNVRIVAATHQPLRELAASGGFRADLYYRLAVFLIRTPALAEHSGDIPALAGLFMERMAQDAPAKSLHGLALERLLGYGWPGNVRELEHVLERAWILAEDRPEIRAEEIEFGDE